jgi:hypothetical protein|eukprot:COSAG02_NODE_7350_length_3052_cov_203.124619_3_plen_53_part_00
MEHGEQAGAVQLQTGTFWWTMGPTQPLIWVVTLASVSDITGCVSTQDQLRLY